MEVSRTKVRLVMGSGYTVPIRCEGCNALLFKAKLPLQKSLNPLGIEIKCRRCGSMNKL
jgi:phage FluMu protein Com